MIPGFTAVGWLPTHRRNPHFVQALAVLSVLLAASTATASSAAELIQNGGFEANGGSLDGWTVSGAVQPLVAADYVPCCGTTGSEPGFSSNHFAAFGAGDVAGTNVLSQSFATVVGDTYHLSFLTGALGWPGAQAVVVAPIGAYAGGGVGNVVKSDYDDVFSGISVDFVATEAMSTLTFTVKSVGVDSLDEILDNVSVTGPLGSVAPVPEPAAWALMLAGFFGAGSLLRRRQGLVRARA